MVWRSLSGSAHGEPWAALTLAAAERIADHIGKDLRLVGEPMVRGLGGGVGLLSR